MHWLRLVNIAGHKIRAVLARVLRLGTLCSSHGVARTCFRASGHSSVAVVILADPFISVFGVPYGKGWSGRVGL